MTRNPWLQESSACSQRPINSVKPSASKPAQELSSTSPTKSAEPPSSASLKTYHLLKLGVINPAILLEIRLDSSYRPYCPPRIDSAPDEKHRQIGVRQYSRNVPSHLGIVVPRVDQPAHVMQYNRPQARRIPANRRSRLVVDHCSVCASHFQSALLHPQRKLVVLFSKEIILCQRAGNLVLE